MSVTKITDHVSQAVDRLAEQYKEKTLVEGLVKAFVPPIQDLEDVFCDLETDRQLNNAVGLQLDNFGTIVGRDREGFDDDFYRILLQVQIGINNSEGTPEDIISTLKLLSENALVHFQNLGDGQIGLSVGAELDQTQVDFIFENLERVVMAGVRINFLSCFDPDEPFSFDGSGPVGLGFSSLAAPTTGGKFGFLHRRTKPQFALNTEAGTTDPNGGGFGTVLDPHAGGFFQGL